MFYGIGAPFGLLVLGRVLCLSITRKCQCYPPLCQYVVSHGPGNLLQGRLAIGDNIPSEIYYYRMYISDRRYSIREYKYQRTYDFREDIPLENMYIREDIPLENMYIREDIPLENMYIREDIPLEKI